MPKLAGVICDGCGKRAESVTDPNRSLADPSPWEAAHGWYHIQAFRFPYDASEPEFGGEDADIVACSPPCVRRAVDAALEQLVPRRKPRADGGGGA